MDAEGSVVAKLTDENANSEYNSLRWNSGNEPSGRYTVTIEHNGSIIGKSVLLK